MVEKDAVRRAYAGRRTATPPGVQLLDSLPAESRVLDAGCGSGQPALSRLSESTTAIGVDFSREQLLLAADMEDRLTAVDFD